MYTNVNPQWDLLGLGQTDADGKPPDAEGGGGDKPPPDTGTMFDDEEAEQIANNAGGTTNASDALANGDTASSDTAASRVTARWNAMPTWFKVVSKAAGIAGTVIGAYHGYKRNDSVGWAIGWGLLGGMFPVIVIPVAFAQGIGTRKR